MVSITSDKNTQQCADDSTCTDVLVKEENHTLELYKGCKFIPHSVLVKKIWVYDL
jgi:hypothetical protein